MNLFSVIDPAIRLMPFTDIPDLIGGPENKAVGIYLRAEGNISGHIMMVIPYAKALELVDLVMYEPVGTTQKLGSIERSALAELGNLTGSFFLNAIDEKMGIGSRPSPPAVMVDMVGAILDILIATSDGFSENILMVQAKFIRAEGMETQVDFWMVPDRQTLEAIAKKGISTDA